MKAGFSWEVSAPWEEVKPHEPEEHFTFTLGDAKVEEIVEQAPAG
jgi:hypothetical protein